MTPRLIDNHSPAIAAGGWRAELAKAVGKVVFEHTGDDQDGKNWSFLGDFNDSDSFADRAADCMTGVLAHSYNPATNPEAGETLVAIATPPRPRHLTMSDEASRPLLAVFTGFELLNGVILTPPPPPPCYRRRCRRA